MSGLRVVIAGGGTGGHLFPGLAVARELRRRDPAAAISFAGTARGLEARVVPAQGFALDVIRSAGLKGRSLAARLKGVLLLPLSGIDAWRLLSARRPDVVIGVGGYSSGPVVLIAALRGCPTMVLEQNAVPGVTNRWLARVVRAAAVSYEGTLDYFRGRGFVAGNPVRPEFLSGRAADGRAPTPRRVLVLGGSQGAHTINLAMVAAAAELAGRHPGLEVVHQTGARDLDAVREGYARAGVRARAELFLDAVADEMTKADVIVCRAGATTLAEVAAIGRAAVLVPFGAAADDHQRKNARALAAAGAADIVDERELDGARLAAAVSRLLDDGALRARREAAVTAFARPDAAARIADKALALAGGAVR
jgi:UDP-N-acetylglucosamine--N-acetylmuramyl-(pentapeptide) pyrophosphoryl-undecaprenol N-acetylglucosamine transferase